MTHKSMDIWTITKAAGKGTTELLSNHLFSTNECNQLNHSNKESGTDFLWDHAIFLGCWRVVTRLSFLLLNWNRKSYYIHAAWNWLLPCKELWTAVVETFLSKLCFFPSCKMGPKYRLPATARFAWCSRSCLHFLILIPSLGKFPFNSALLPAEFQLSYFPREEHNILCPFTVIKDRLWRGRLALHLSFFTHDNLKNEPQQETCHT